MKREFVLTSVGVVEAGLELGYVISPDDVRSEGHVVFARHVSVSFEAPAGLGEQARAAVDALRTLVVAAHEAELPIYDPPAVEAQPPTWDGLLRSQEQDDDDVGMGDGR